MTIDPTRIRAISCTAVIVVLFLTGCGPGSSPSATPSSLPSASAAAEPDVTLTNSGCSAAPADPPPGEKAIEILNSSSSLASFELLRVSSFEDFDQYLVDSREAFAAGSPLPGGLPFIEEELGAEFAEPGATAYLTSDLTAGTYAVLCVVRDDDENIVAAYAVGPYTVSE